MNFNPVLQKPLKILQASAGSGKTFSLTAHYLTLLFDNELKYREVLAVTFTNKATEEMKSRILSVLCSLALGEESVAVFRKIIQEAHPFLNPKALQERAHQIYRRILHDYSRFAINTIDGFVQQVIRSFTFELGLDAGYKLEMNQDKVKKALTDKLNERLDEKPELLQWIINLALDRVSENKSWNYRRELLDLTSEIFKERYQPFENALKALDVATLFQKLMVDTRGCIADFEKKLKVLANEALQVWEKSGVQLDELKGKSRHPFSKLPKLAAGGDAVFTDLKKVIDCPEEYQKGGNLTASVGTLFSRLNPVLISIQNFFNAETGQYEMAKAINTNLYYLRLMQEMAALLKDYREENQTLLISDAQYLLKGITADQQDNPSFIWEKMGSRYKNFLFDEFQDTSAFQWDNFLPLLQNALAEATGKFTDHLIVGDVKQSIYRWRNGDWRILLQKAKADIGNHNVIDQSLEENYRSAANIIDFNNHLFQEIPNLLQNLINNKILEDGSEDLYNNWWKAAGLEHIIPDAYRQSFQKKAGSTLPGGSVEVLFLPVENNVYRATQVREAALLQLSEKLNDWTGSGRYQAGQICILVRSNREAREVIAHLMADQQMRKIKQETLGETFGAYEVLSGEALLINNNSAVKLLVSTLQLMVTQNGQSVLYKGLCVQLYFKQLGKSVPASAWTSLKETPVTKLQNLLPAELCRNFYAWQQLPLNELAEQLITVYGLGEQQQHLPYLFAFRDMLARFTQQGELGITRFLEWWDEEGQLKALPSGSQNDAVQVMTIHKSKGLAFDVVMLPFCSWDLDGMTNSIFWVDTKDTPYEELKSVPINYKKALGKSAFSKAYFEELLFNLMDALNMLYVATTRTRNHLYITAPGQGKNDCKTSIVGDLILEALKKPVAGLNASFIGENFVLDEPLTEKAPVKTASEGKIQLKKYPVSQRLSQALASKKVWGKLDLLSGDAAQHKGIILHELLARTMDVAKLQKVINEMQQEGLIREAEKEGIKINALNVLQNKALKALLSKPYQDLSEQTIIDSKGESYRPDKVLIGNEEVLIIDFKFTSDQRPEHFTQVKAYQKLLTDMGYEQVNGYLYYGFLQELVTV
ncbi:UvrD-helicase domain-containing protein [Mucilaginibacter arboris]|uniref:DNA 3'-5' helicase n=1 Tax=Mucilaginibacter arboris TaxID=2682090 RepID=A0A7K1SZS0_9SPHI|nr:UvrD-helicase domain-containing protein [Mucilaginibacter arboris]MVN22814.1 AAA family ATPase [Mucilaginibacter arboris]